ncbi:MAG TPA: DUF4349 domain-containing protein [Chitinophagaceae bacterium]|nr:DUF4349 domain-containing protein [Chitinophagaceae bacterium]
MAFVYKISAALLLCSLMACQQAVKENKSIEIASVNSDANLERQMQTVAADSSLQVPGGVKNVVSSGNNTVHVDWDKKIVKTGQLKLEVKDCRGFNVLLHEKVRNLGGYIAQEQQQENGDRIENRVSIKVPVDQFDAAVEMIIAGSDSLLEKTVDAQDMTAQMVDISSRMEAKKRVRERYMDMLKQAKNIEEILHVQHEIDDMQETIEAASGRLQYLGHAAAFSTLTITFYQMAPPTPNTTEPSYGRRLLDSFTLGLHWISELLVALMSIWPLYIVITTIWIVARKRGRLNKKIARG